MKKAFQFAFLLANLIAFVTDAHANNLLEPEKRDQLIIVAPENCPYNCATASRRNYNELEHYNQKSQYERADPHSSRYFDGYGYIIDIIKEIFEPLGHKVSYKTLSHKDALRKVFIGRYELFAGISASDNEALGDSKFLLSTETIGNAQKHFFVTSDFDWRFYGFDSLYNINLGLIENNKYPELGAYLEANKDQKQKISFEPQPSDTAINSNLRKLLRGQINAIFEDANIVNFYLQNMNLTDQVTSAGSTDQPAKDSELFLGISKKSPEAAYLQKTFDDGIKKLRKTGRLKEILVKYNLKDWYSKPAGEDDATK